MTRPLVLVSNWQDLRCGVANFGRDWAQALMRAGHAVQLRGWDAPPVPDAVTLFNWHPFLAPADLTYWPGLYGVYLHDPPPWSTCGLVPGAAAVWAPEPVEGAQLLPYPIWDGPRAPEAWITSPVTIGWTGIRGDGIADLEALCRTRGWHLNRSTTWRDTPEEVVRLAQSTLIVLWYYASGRGQSLALSTACATGRPVLVNQSAMFHLATYGGVMRAGVDIAPPHLAPAIDEALDRIWKGTVPIPHLTDRFGWAAAVRQMEALWQPSLV